MRMGVAGVWFIALGVAHVCGFMVPKTFILDKLTMYYAKSRMKNYIARQREVCTVLLRHTNKACLHWGLRLQTHFDEMAPYIRHDPLQLI